MNKSDKTWSSKLQMSKVSSNKVPGLKRIANCKGWQIFNWQKVWRSIHCGSMNYVSLKIMLTKFYTNGKDNLSLNNSWQHCYDSSLMRRFKDSIIRERLQTNFNLKGTPRGRVVHWHSRKTFDSCRDPRKDRPFGNIYQTFKGLLTPLCCCVRPSASVSEISAFNLANKSRLSCEGQSHSLGLAARL